MTTRSVVVRLTVTTVLACLLAGCAAEFWGTSTYNPAWACASFSGWYRESDGTCQYGSGP